MKIACASVFDPASMSSWSGCSHYLLKALRQKPGTIVDIIGPLQERNFIQHRVKGKLHHWIGRNYLANVTSDRLVHFAAQVAEKTEDSDADFILSLDAAPIAHLSTTKPIVYYWDCTFEGNLEYPWFANLAGESKKAGHRAEQLALDVCDIAVFSSQWAIKSAVERYKIDPSKLRLAPLGANLVGEQSRSVVESAISARPRNTCKLLFLGIDWKRKGGDLAYQLARTLNDQGLPTELTIVGCDPAVDGPLPDYVKAYGFLDKAQPENRKLIEQLLSESHFLVVPSLAESFGVVFCEASSFGTPSLSRRVGGIPEAIHEGLNGFTFDSNASVVPYSDTILGLFSDYSKYESLAFSSYDQYLTRLNWSETANAILRYGEEAIGLRAREGVQRVG